MEPVEERAPVQVGVVANASGESEAGPPAVDGKVIEGKDGWLFVAFDTLDVIGQHTGALRLTDRELRDWRLILETRTAWLEKLGMHYFFMLSINPHTLYPELLPDEYTMAEERTVEQLIRHLHEAGSYARVIYPLPEILEAKQRRPVACRTSSHWNAVGAYAAYRKLIAEIGAVTPVYVVPEERVDYFEAERFADLGIKVEPPRKSVNTFANVNGQRARLVADNFILRRGRIAEFECPTAPESTCLLLGDSFNYQMMPFLAESFRKLIFAHLHTVDHDLVQEYRPDVVVNVMNERGLSELMYDLPAPTTRDFAARKAERGEVDAGSGRIWRASPTAPAVDKGC
jgi:alginate O-acetyltransferase complex protein AlgJ